MLAEALAAHGLQGSMERADAAQERRLVAAQQHALVLRVLLEDGRYGGRVLLQRVLRHQRQPRLVLRPDAPAVLRDALDADAFHRNHALCRSLSNSYGSTSFFDF
jgi:hypothetical protein